MPNCESASLEGLSTKGDEGSGRDLLRALKFREGSLIDGGTLTIVANVIVMTPTPWARAPSSRGRGRARVW